MKDFFSATPKRTFLTGVFVLVALVLDFIVPWARTVLIGISALATLPTLASAAGALFRFRITIDVFNAVALVVSLAAGEFRSTAFIVLMLISAEFLQSRTRIRSGQAVEALLRLRPEKAKRVRTDGVIEEVTVKSLLVGDTVLVENGSRVPVDGTVIFGSAFIDESSLTGESKRIEKRLGDLAFSATLVDEGMIKIRATRVGEDTTVEQMARLVREAIRFKSPAENLADRFAAIFLPVVALTGIAAYAFTHDIGMTAALFLVACADDMAVAVPLAITASLGRAAKRGVIIKGGKRLDIFRKITTLVLDKTGTLTYGKLALVDVHIQQGVDHDYFWKLLAIAEKFSEHPIGRAAFQEAARRCGTVPDPDEFTVRRGSGVSAHYEGTEILLGDETLLKELRVELPKMFSDELSRERTEHAATSFFVLFDRKPAGVVTVADTPRAEAAESIRQLKMLGVKRIAMFTGDNEEVARNVARTLGINEYHAHMQPDEKLLELEAREAAGDIVAMVGDGVNDAPVLARADIGIAMGGGSAVAIEAADAVILTDDLSRLPEMVRLGQQTFRVIRDDMILWVLSNAIGFALVLSGFAGPAIAAFYNFATDFLPLLSSMRLFRAQEEGSARLSVR